MKFVLLVWSTCAQIFGIGKETTERPLLFEQDPSNLRPSTDEPKYLFITSDPKYSKVDHTISEEDYLKNRQYGIVVDKIPRGIESFQIIFDPIATCFRTEDECNTKTTNCSSHGSCKLVRSCFYCECTLKKFTDDNGKLVPGYDGHVDWVGEACELQDLTTETSIILVLVVVFLIILVLTIMLLASLGSMGGSVPVGDGKPKTE